MRKDPNASTQTCPQLDLEFLVEYFDEIFSVCVGNDFCELDDETTAPSFLELSHTFDSHWDSNEESNYSQEFYDNQLPNSRPGQPLAPSTPETNTPPSACLPLDGFTSYQAKLHSTDASLATLPLQNDLGVSNYSLTKLSTFDENKNTCPGYELSQTNFNEMRSKRIKLC